MIKQYQKIKITIKECGEWCNNHYIPLMITEKQENGTITFSPTQSVDMIKNFKTF